MPEKGLLRDNGKRKPSVRAIDLSRMERDPSAPNIVTAQTVRESLNYARSIPDPERFRVLTQTTLERTVPFLNLVINGTFARYVGTERETPAMVGICLSGVIINKLITQEDISAEQCTENLSKWDILRRGIQNPEQVTEGHLITAFGPDTAGAFMEIRSDFSRGICAPLVDMTVNPLIPRD